MIERDRDFNTFDIHCDRCSHAIEVDTDGHWDAMIAEIKEDGWKVIFYEGEYEHYCPTCTPPDPVERALNP